LAVTEVARALSCAQLLVSLIQVVEASHGEDNDWRDLRLLGALWKLRMFLSVHHFRLI
jgi:hypothetical protein